MDASLRDRVIGLVAKVLQVSPNDVGPEGAIDVTPRWDSLAQLNVLVLIEQEAGVSIDPEDGVDLVSVAAICDFLAKAGLGG